MFVFMCDTIMEDGRHLGILKKAAGLLNMSVVPTVHSVSIWQLSQNGPFITSKFRIY